MENLMINKIEKEQVKELEFFKENTQRNKIERKKIHNLLYMGMLLGNSYRHKVKIIFESMDGRKMVETTIWATTENNVILKGGTTIPVSAIVDIHLC
ncbi:MAG: hypothetical protein WD048_14915 [Chitinophagales bacterium]